MQSIQVDFYLLSDDKPQALLWYACRLLEKAYLQGFQIWVWCADDTQASTLDSMLWDFKKESFIPHALASEASSFEHPIEISTHYPASCKAPVLLNLSNQLVSTPTSTLSRILEIVPHLESEKIKSRTRYRAYREAQYDLRTHTI